MTGETASAATPRFDAGAAPRLLLHLRGRYPAQIFARRAQAARYAVAREARLRSDAEAVLALPLPLSTAEIFAALKDTWAVEYVCAWERLNALCAAGVLTRVFSGRGMRGRKLLWGRP